MGSGKPVGSEEMQASGSQETDFDANHKTLTGSFNQYVGQKLKMYSLYFFSKTASRFFIFFLLF